MSRSGRSCAARLDELTASRARIVEAIGAERKRIERNLHDCTQQRLTSITLSLGLAEARIGSDPAAAPGWLRQPIKALNELRDRSRGIHVSVLTDSALLPALQDLVYTTPLLIALVATVNGRLPERVEESAHHLVAEALTNIAKYADATSATVRVCEDSGWLRMSIRDDGCGAPIRAAEGVAGLGQPSARARWDVHRSTAAPVPATEIRAGIPCAQCSPMIPYSCGRIWPVCSPKPASTSWDAPATPTRC